MEQKNQVQKNLQEFTSIKILKKLTSNTRFMPGVGWIIENDNFIEATNYLLSEQEDNLNDIIDSVNFHIRKGLTTDLIIFQGILNWLYEITYVRKDNKEQYYITCPICHKEFCRDKNQERWGLFGLTECNHESDCWITDFINRVEKELGMQVSPEEEDYNNE